MKEWLQVRWLLRKLGSLHIRMSAASASAGVRAQAWLNPGISISPGCRFGRGASLRATDGGRIRLGPGVFVGPRAQLVAQGGLLTIGPSVHLGTGSILVCRAGIDVGADTLIAEYAVIRDQDHDTNTRPVRHSGFLTSPIRIGCDVWVGAKPTILRGVNIGDQAVIGAHALVRSDVPGRTLAVGVPARLKAPVDLSA